MRKPRKFGVYDFEWWAFDNGDECKCGHAEASHLFGGHQCSSCDCHHFVRDDWNDFVTSQGKKPYDFRCAGYLDERGAVDFFTVEDFLNYVLRPDNCGRLMFAHWGGISDVLFLIRPLFDRGEKVNLVMNASAAAIVTVTRGKKRWSFVDSSFIFRMGLADLAEMQGLKKGGDERLTWKERDVNRLLEYNRLDNFILYESIEKFQGIVNGMGAKMGLTMSATAMDLLRRKYLKAPIVTPSEVNDFSFRAYYASRVEVYRPRMDFGQYFDVNSSFVYSMTHTLPGSPTHETMGSEAGGWGNKLPKDGLYIAECKVRVPDMYLPPLAYRDEQSHRLFYPTGEWTAPFTSVDLDLAREMGCEILDVQRVVHFEPRDDFADFANDVYGKRMAATEKFLKSSFKLVGNGCYGKLSEGEEKCEFVMHPEHTFCQNHFVVTPETVFCKHHGQVDCPICLDICDCISSYSPGIWRVKVEKELAHRHVATGAFIVSIARRTLYRGQLAYQDHLHYSDTDSVFLSVMMQKTGKALGDFKYEGPCSDMRFVAPKVYGGKTWCGLCTTGSCDRSINGETYCGAPILHAKGFRLGKKTFDNVRKVDTYGPDVVKRYTDIVEQRPTFDSRMIRPKEYMRTLGEIKDVAIGNDGKTLRLTDRPKRCYIGDNNTRPWTVDEIRSPWKGPLSVVRALHGKGASHGYTLPSLPANGLDARGTRCFVSILLRLIHRRRTRFAQSMQG